MPENIGDFEEQIEQEQGPGQEVPQVEESGPGLKERFSFLFVQTGQGPVSSYVDHPLNFSRSEGLAQVIRGITGMLGSLEYAIVDIVIGIFRWRSEIAAKNTEVVRA